jgi:hypothetical protein
MTSLVVSFESDDTVLLLLDILLNLRRVRGKLPLSMEKLYRAERVRKVKFGGRLTIANDLKREASGGG